MSAKQRSTGGDVARVLLALTVITVVVVLASTRLAESTMPDHADPSSDNTDASTSSDVGTTVEAIGLTPHRRHTGPVLVVGDSITVGAQGAGLPALLRKDGWRPTITADTGQAPRWGIDQVKKLTTVPPLVVVELGTNPSSGIGTFPDDIKVMAKELKSRGAKRIVWITPVHRGDDLYDDKVALLDELAATDPTVVVADWGTVTSGHPDWFQSDGLHYTSTGYKVLAQYLADVIDQNDPQP